MRGEWMDAACIFDRHISSRIEMLHRVMREQLKRMAKTLELTVNQLELIVILSMSELNTAGEIAKALGVSRSLLSKTVEELVQAGCIEAVPDERDRRMIRLHLTPQAQETAEHCKAMQHAFYQEICAGIDGGDMDVTFRVLRQMWENMGRMLARTEGGCTNARKGKA